MKYKRLLELLNVIGDGHGHIFALQSEITFLPYILLNVRYAKNFQTSRRC